MKFCTKCGKVYDDSENYCEDCGVELQSTQIKTCKICGNTYLGRNYCEDCGVKLS